MNLATTRPYRPDYHKKWRKRNPKYYLSWRKKNPEYFKNWLENNADHRRSYMTEYMRKYRVKVKAQISTPEDQLEADQQTSLSACTPESP